METSDDPVTASYIYLSATKGKTGGVFSQQVSGFGGDDNGFRMPSTQATQATQATRTAGPLTQLSEQAKRNKRLRVSMLTRDWGKPKLGYAGLLGL